MIPALFKRHGRIVVSAVSLIVLFSLYLVIHPRGFSVYVLTIWSNQGALLALAAIAQFFMVLVCGIDLSIGPVVALSNVAASYLVSGSTVQVAAGVVAVLVVGTVCGLTNGAAVVYGRVP